MSGVYKATVDPTRRVLLDELVERDRQTLFELCDRSTMKHGVSSSRQAISQHLDVLAAAGLVIALAGGRHTFHSIDTTPARHRRPLAAAEPRGHTATIKLASVFVDDRATALEFYTDVLGFVTKTEVAVGEFRWPTVVSPDEPGGVESQPEPPAHPAVLPSRRALVDDGIPAAQFAADDLQAEYERLKGLGVTSAQEPTEMGPVTTAVFDDTCGDLVRIADLQVAA